jgi:hypothetical protein
VNFEIFNFHIFFCEDSNLLRRDAVYLGEEISVSRNIILLSSLGSRSCSSVTKYQGVQYLTCWRTRLMWFSQLNLSVRFDLRLICGHFISGHTNWFLHIFLILRVKEFTLKMKEIRPFETSGTLYPTTRCYNPDAQMFYCYLFEVSLCQ